LEADQLMQTAVEDVEEVRFRFPAAAQPVQAS